VTIDVIVFMTTENTKTRREFENHVFKFVRSKEQTFSMEML